MKPAETQPRDVLRELGEQFRHLEHVQAREPAQSTYRRRIGRELDELAARFEHTLGEWVDDEALRRRWRAFLHGRGGAPDEPTIPAPPLFLGRNEAGALVEVRARGDGYDVLVDGARYDRDDSPWQLEPDMREPFWIANMLCEEVFVAPDDAVLALADFVAGRAPPPWRWARALVEDGLVDVQLALTPRGARRLRRAPSLAPPPRARNMVVVVADAARARVLVLDQTELPRLIEVAEITNPLARARDRELVSQARPAARELPILPRGDTSDHRDVRRREAERHFAARIAEEAAAVWRGYPRCEVIVAAGPAMLGLLRPALARAVRAGGCTVRELARELTKLTPSALHDQLADQALLPPRGRAAPLQPIPGQPV